jgi:predicted transcriptional regulator
MAIKKKPKSEEKKAPRGRPSKKNDTRVEVALKLYEKGMIDVEVAQILGISERTLNYWKKESPELLQSIKEAKKGVDDEVEDSLLKNCLGYEIEEEVAKVVNDGKGKTKLSKTKVKRHYRAETGAIIFWLKNRQPKRWQEKYTVTDEDKNIDDMSDEEVRSEMKRLEKLIEVMEDDNACKD